MLDIRRGENLTQNSIKFTKISNPARSPSIYKGYQIKKKIVRVAGLLYKGENFKL